MFELHSLRCFSVVARELNFRRAAERLNMTQPPLSRQIRLLEHRLGVPLFERNTRSVRLTAAGRRFLVEAEALLEQAEQATHSARRIAAGDSGEVSLGFVANAVYEFLPQLVAELHEAHPQLRLNLREMPTQEQQQALSLGRIDLAIVREPLQRPGLHCEVLLSEPFVLAMPRTHRLATQAALQLSDLQDAPFLLYGQATWQPFNALLRGLFLAQRVQPRIVQEVGSTLTLLSLVNAGLGLALVPRSARALPFDGLCLRELALPTGIDSRLYLARREDDDNPACTRVADALQAAARRIA